MAAEIKIQLSGLPNPLTGAKYKVEKPTFTGSDVLEDVDSGTIDILGNGSATLPIAGKGVNLGDNVQMTVHNFDGVNFTTAGNAMYWTVVTDDGVAPPAVWNLIPLGDSFTDSASSNIYTGARPANQSVGVTQKGYCFSASLMLTDSDYIYRTDMGKSGMSTAEMLSLTYLDDYRARDANLAMILLGTNDTGPSADPQVSIDNYTTIINALRADDKFQVLIVPATHRNDDVNFAVRNSHIDQLNAHCATLAANTDGVEICEVNAEFNTRIMTDQVNFGGVSDDGLHPNNAGGLLLAKTAAAGLDLYYPSQLSEKTNLAPDEFTGTGGTRLSGTGVIPDGYTGSYANNSTEDGFTGPIDRGDGKVWWKIRTNGGTVVSRDNESKLLLQPVVCTEGWDATELKVEFVNGHLITKCRLVVNSGGATYSYSDISTAQPNTGDIFEDGVVYKIRTPTARVENDTVTMYFETTQKQGDDAIIYITDNKLYKVEDL